MENVKARPAAKQREEIPAKPAEFIRVYVLFLF
jgi:hypothetical protein